MSRMTVQVAPRRAAGPALRQRALLRQPAVKRGRMVKRIGGEPSGQPPEGHDAGDFDTKTADKVAVPR